MPIVCLAFLQPTYLVSQTCVLITLENNEEHSHFPICFDLSEALLCPNKHILNSERKKEKRKHSEAAKDAKVDQSSMYVYGKVRETIRSGTSVGVDSEFLSTYLFEPIVMRCVCVCMQISFIRPCIQLILHLMLSPLVYVSSFVLPEFLNTSVSDTYQ